MAPPLLEDDVISGWPLNHCDVFFLVRTIREKENTQNTCAMRCMRGMRERGAGRRGMRSMRGKRGQSLVYVVCEVYVL